MGLTHTPIHEELMFELPSNASSNQSNVKPGFYRTTGGQHRKITTHRRVGRLYAKVPDINNFAPIGGSTKLVPKKDQIIVKVDKFSDEGTCRACHGEGHGEATCAECAGNKSIWVDPVTKARDKRASSDRSLLVSVDCPQCLASTYSSPLRRSTGRVVCLPCKGTGQALGGSHIAMSNEYEGEPTTGVVLAIGPDVTRCDRGERIMFARFAGQEYEYDGRKYRIMSENYPLGQIIGNADVKVRECVPGVG